MNLNDWVHFKFNFKILSLCNKLKNYIKEKGGEMYILIIYFYFFNIFYRIYYNQMYRIKFNLLLMLAKSFK